MTESALSRSTARRAFRRASQCTTLRYAAFVAYAYSAERSDRIRARSCPFPTPYFFLTRFCALVGVTFPPLPLTSLTSFSILSIDG